jgi:hypothetical protein
MTVRRADDNLYTLGTGLTATGPAVAIRGGEYQFFLSGTPGSATTFQLETLSPSGNWSRVQVFSGSVLAFTAANLPIAQTGVDLPACNVRLAIIGGTATSISASLIGLG